ncbi:hypothetical protein PIROE2DRAFT_2411 [Piromyces sp. E2]|nr:hypothetical protein PIROE2DRAFT_2411 [Piromyces sp. E2]|eukprot:OUM69550.1 hypothetical protein PIROE2DRAFT_2411 [Piromyces sp. E2]
MGNVFSVDITGQTVNEINNNYVSNNDLKGKSLIQDDESINLINIKKSSNYEEMECIDDYCSNFYINGEKKQEKEDLKKTEKYSNNEEKNENKNNNVNDNKINSENEEFSDCINIIKIGKFNKMKNKNTINSNDNNLCSSDSNLQVVNNNIIINRSASGVSHNYNNININNINNSNNNDGNNNDGNNSNNNDISNNNDNINNNNNNYLSINRQASNMNSSYYSSTIINDNSKYSSVTTVNRNNSINCHNSSYIENMLKNHHEDTNINHNDNILSGEFISHEDLLDNFDNGISSSNPDNGTSSFSCDSSINKKFEELLKSNNDLNNNDDNLLLNQVCENNDVCLDINNDDDSSCCSSKDYENGDINEFVNMGSFFFNNKDIMSDNNVTNYDYSPTHYNIWDVKESADMLDNNYNENKNYNNTDYYNGDSSYKSSYSDTFVKNKYKGFQEFKSTANSSSYYLNKDEKLKTDSQIMLFPEIAKQISNEKIKVYNSKPFSISSYNSNDDCSSILNYSPSKQTSFYQKDNGDMYESSLSRINSNTFNDTNVFNDNNSTSVLHITRSNSVVINNENDFNANKKLTNLVRESQYNLKNLKNITTKDKSKDKNLNKMAIRYNSCSTLLIDNTITTADMDDTIKCVTLAIFYRIRANHKKNVKLVTNKIFSEKLYPLTRHPRISPNPPSEKEIYKFLNSLFHAAELNSECAIISLIYVERMLAYTNITIHSCNWTRILLGGVLLASKVWDDHAIWNADFCQIFPTAAVEDM